MGTLIWGDNLWSMWAVVLTVVAIAFYLEQHYKWAGKVSSVLLALIMGLILVNVHAIPSSSPVYSAIGGYILPWAIPMLLFQSNIRKIFKESGRMLGIFMVASFFSIIGGILCGFLFRGALGDQTTGYVAVEVGADIGGSVNIVAMANAFHVDESLMNASLIIGNLIIIIWTAAIIAIPNMKYFRAKYRHEYIDLLESNLQAESGESLAAKYWSKKEISLLDIAKCLGTSTLILALAQAFCGWINSMAMPSLVQQILGNVYLALTTLTIAGVALFPKYFENIKGANEIGTIMITLYFVQLGASANIPQILQMAPAVLGFKIIMAVINIGGMLLVGRFTHWNIEECLTCSNASLGGPTTAAAYCISKGWSDLIAPATLVGLLGYIIGNYFAVLTASIF